MRVLVTGFAGYIGPVIVKHLRLAGHEVIGLDTGWFLSNYAEMPTWPHATLWRDLRWTRPIDHLGAVVHLAGLSNDPLGELDPDLTQRINERATLDLIGRLPSTRHVIVSSCSVYGKTDEAATIDTPPSPLTAYARAKAHVDLLAPQRASNVLSLRLGTVWGYSPGHRLDLVVNRMIYDAIHAKRVTATGNAWRPIVHVEDVARAVADAVVSTDTGIRNIVGENVQMQELADRIADYCDVPRTYTTGDGDTRDYRALGYEMGPMRSVFDDADLSDLYVNTQLLPVKSIDHYIRIKSIQRLKALGLLDESLRRAA